MIHKVFSLYDSKIGSYMLPEYRRSKGEMIRALTNTMENPDNGIARNPEDFFLYYIGEFDDESATFTQGAPESLGSALEFKKSD